MKKIGWITVFFLLCSSPLMASTLIDTGPGPIAGGYSLTSSQWLAGEFELDQDYYITGLYGWVSRGSTLEASTDYHFSITIYGDGGEIPDESNLIYSNSAQISGPNSEGKWAGYEITWTNSTGNTGQFLSAGTYWAAFEVRPPNYNNPLAGTMPRPSDNPLTNYALRSSSGWLENYDDANFGLRVLGTPSAIPEPTTMLLLGFGLLGLAGVNRRKK